jgi:hypothetical protein
MSGLLFFLTVLLRLLPHPANFAPMGAASIFAGAKLNKKQVFIFTLIAAFVTDYLLLYINPFSPTVLNLGQVYSPLTAIHGTTFFVYLSFMISTALGLSLRRGKTNYLKVGAVAILSATLFFLITNFGVWATGAYARNLSGLMMSYQMALPFFKMTLASDLIYSLSIFAIYDLAVKLKAAPIKLKSLKPAHESA